MTFLEYTVHLLVIVNVLVCSAQAKAKMKKYVWLQDVRSCSVESGMSQLNGSFRYTGQGSFYLNLDLYTPEKLDKVYFLADIKKCPTKLPTDDCEDLMSFPAGEQCISEDAYFRFLYSQFQPPIHCPLSGHYKAVNVVFESERYSLFFRGISDDEWLHAYLYAFSDEKKTKKKLCILIIAAMRKIRVSNKNNQNKKH